MPHPILGDFGEEEPEVALGRVVALERRLAEREAQNMDCYQRCGPDHLGVWVNGPNRG